MDQDRVADPYPLAVTERNRRQRFSGTDPEECDVGLWIGTDQFGGEFPLIVEPDADLRCAIDHVMVGYDEATFIRYEAGSEGPGFGGVAVPCAAAN